MIQFYVRLWRVRICIPSRVQLVKFGQIRFDKVSWKIVFWNPCYQFPSMGIDLPFDGGRGYIGRDTDTSQLNQGPAHEARSEHMTRHIGDRER